MIEPQSTKHTLIVTTEDGYVEIVGKDVSAIKIQTKKPEQPQVQQQYIPLSTADDFSMVK